MQVETIVSPVFEQEMKVCSKCIDKTPKPLSAFGAHSAGKYGRQAACRECESNRSIEYRKSHPHIIKTANQRTQQGRKERYQHDSEMRDRSRKATKKSRIKRVYNLSYAEYLAMYERQSGLCAICGHAETVRNQWGVMSLAIDHNHATGTVRGLLCNRCNVKLKILEDESYMCSALAYLERYRV